MISIIGRWISAIAGISIIVSLIDAITPENAAGKFASLAGSLILTFVILSPFTNFNLSQLNYDEIDFNYKVEEHVKMAIENNNNLRTTIEAENYK